MKYMYNASTTWCHLQMMSDVAGRTDVERAGSQKHEIEEKLFYVGWVVKGALSVVFLNRITD